MLNPDEWKRLAEELLAKALLARSACRHCGACLNPNPFGLPWCSSECYYADTLAEDCAFLLACGVRADDDVLTPDPYVRNASESWANVQSL